MSINATVVREPEGTWLFTWAVGTPPYTIFLDGRLLASGLTVESFLYEEPIHPDEAPPLEILNAGEIPQNVTFPPRIQLQWRALQAAAAYIIEQFIDAAFIEVAQIMENARGYHNRETEPLADATVHQFQVRAISVSEAQGAPLSFSIDMVRNPNTPKVAFSLDTAGNIVVAAA